MSVAIIRTTKASCMMSMIGKLFVIKGYCWCGCNEICCVQEWSFRAVLLSLMQVEESCTSKTTNALGSRAPPKCCDDKDKSRLDSEEELGYNSGRCQRKHADLVSGRRAKKSEGGGTGPYLKHVQGGLLHEVPFL